MTTRVKPPARPTPSPTDWARWFLWLLVPPLPIAKRLGLVTLAIGIYSTLVSYIIHASSPQPVDVMGTSSTVLNGVVLGVLLGFRNNEAIKRWWEARTLWGQLINDVRNFCLKVRAYVEPSVEDARRLGTMLASFAYALKKHLRGDGAQLQDFAGFEAETQTPKHIPGIMAERIAELVAGWKREGKIDGYTFLALDPHVKALMDVCGACERIKSSPLPLSYRALLRHGIAIYFAFSPWYVAAEIGYWTVPVLVLVGYFLFGVELTAEDVEEPFGRDADDLALGQFCRIIEASVEDILGPIPANLNDTVDGPLAKELATLRE